MAGPLRASGKFCFFARPPQSRPGARLLQAQGVRGERAQVERYAGLASGEASAEAAKHALAPGFPCDLGSGLEEFYRERVTEGRTEAKVSGEARWPLVPPHPSHIAPPLNAETSTPQKGGPLAS